MLQFVRPLDILVGGLRFLQQFFLFFFLFFFLSFFLSFFVSFFFHFLSFSSPTSEIAERNSTKIIHIVGSTCKCDLKIHVPNVGCTIPLKIGPKTIFSRRFRNLAATLMAYAFRTKYDIHNWASALKTTRVSYIVSKCHELWSTKSLKLDLHLYPSSVNSAFDFIARLRRWRPANGIQPSFAKHWTVNRANNLP